MVWTLGSIWKKQSRADSLGKKMKQNPSTLPDDALSKLLSESQVTLTKFHFSAEEVLPRVRKFNELYQALRDKPESAALLYREEASSAAVGCRLIGTKLLVGRLARSDDNSAGCDLVCPDAEMSRFHFEVRCHDGLCLLRDLHSHNGTSINGGPPIDQEVILKAGDTILAGTTIFLFTGV
ncbi:MAG TPA: FHA domain-containing protein [Chthoniobacterales bacterium]|nr:FHA domain-containing protein [Chthoniobacterales bacterium]